MEVDDDSLSPRVTLIRAVRTLDDDKTLSIPDKIHRLWLLLSTSKGTRLHAAEETVLRWLCKHMGGNGDDAEVARRYPLTWAVLGHVFSTIPLQSLGRCLADRRFVSLLHRTLKEVSRKDPSPANLVVSKVESKKRKRDNELPSNIKQLRTSQGCLHTTSEIFKSLTSLLDHGCYPRGVLTPDARVGSEHVKSLFSAAPTDISEICADLLSLCDNSTKAPDNAISEEKRDWVRVVTALWDLRPHSKDDGLGFATYLYQPICSILAGLKRAEGVAPLSGSATVRKIWEQQLDRLLGVYFMRPARQRFSIDKNIESIKAALEITSKNSLSSVVVIWEIASKTARDPTDAKSKLEHASWVQIVFEALHESIQSVHRPSRNRTMVRLLDIAVRTESIPRTETLRRICEDYAIQQDMPDWDLIAKVVECDADVFIMDDDIAQSLFGIITTTSEIDARGGKQIVVDVVLPLLDVFVRARDLQGFARRWYKCICNLKEDKPGVSLENTLWYDYRIRKRFSQALQSGISNTQLSQFLETLDSPGANAEASLVLLDAVSTGITDDTFTETIGSRMLSMTTTAEKFAYLPSSARALRWKVLTSLSHWSSSDEIHRTWTITEPEIRHILRKCPINDPETLEAFKCCYTFWLGNHPDGRDEVELAGLTIGILPRIIAAMEEGECQLSDSYVDIIFDDLPKLIGTSAQGLENMATAIIGLFRLVALPSGHRSRLPELRSHLSPLLNNIAVRDNEPFLEGLFDLTANALESQGTSSGWSRSQGLPLCLLLLEFPREALTKTRRKRIMASWKQHLSAILKTATISYPYAEAMLRLIIRVMEMPTFYERMEFADIVSIADFATEHNQKILQLAQKFAELSLTHMLTSGEEISVAYFKDASSYTEALKTKKQTTAQLLVVKNLASILFKSKSSTTRGLPTDMDIIAKKLRHMIKYGLAKFICDTGPGASEAEPQGAAISLRVILEAAESLPTYASEAYISIADDAVDDLDAKSTSYVSEALDDGFRLKALLIRARPSRYTPKSFADLLQGSPANVEKDTVSDLITAFLDYKDEGSKIEFLRILVTDCTLVSGPVGPLLAASNCINRLLSEKTAQSFDQSDVDDVLRFHVEFLSLLIRTTSLTHFKIISDTLLTLLSKYPAAMTQFNIESTLSTVVDICSSTGPHIEGSEAAGEVYEKLYQLVATVIRKHRHRLEGHFPVLINALQALLGVLLANPVLTVSASTGLTPTRPAPPWLRVRLQERHAAKYSRLLALICEPSAAAVARSRVNTLDSARDMAKRLAGQDMFALLESYIKLQLEGDVPRDVRKALEPGVYAILNITPEGGRRVLNESVDGNGRALFKQMYADYRKFGTWTGI